MASFRLAARFNPPSHVDAWADVYAYLVTIGGDALLIDTGIGEGNAHIDRRFAPRRTSIVDELARFGLTASHVKWVGNSHLHFDHCGNNSVFPNAETFVQADELATARALQSRYTVADWFDYAGARLRPVHGDLQIAPGITLLASPGHTPGHQSVLIESEDARIVVAAQAAYTADEYLTGGDPELQAHEGLNARYTRSIARLKSVGADRVLFSHDSRTVVASAGRLAIA
jgi:N-acyl homoserine lactone hydrolase